MLSTELALIVLFLALGLGGLGGFASAYAVHWVLIHRMRGIDGLLRANYAIAKRAETRAERMDRPKTFEEQITDIRRRNSSLAGIRGE